MYSGKKLSHYLILAAATAALAACQANGGSGGGGGLGQGSVDNDSGLNPDGSIAGDGSSSDTGFPNDPLGPGGDTAGGLIVKDDGSDSGTDEEVAYGDSNGRFRCIVTGADSTEQGANGLVGNVVGGLLGGLGGAPVTGLTNGITELEQAIDQDLKTASTFTIAASLLGGAVNSIDQVFTYNKKVNGYAVAAVSFPTGTADVSLGRTVTVTTYLDEGDSLSEDPTEPPVSTDASAVDLVGQGVVSPGPLFIGRKVSKPYNRMVVSVQGNLLSLDVGEAMYLHEVCTDGAIVQAPAEADEGA